ncbi:hypothetical protein ACFQVD_26580 [Streptosporangium amethystogenes subsp. fukuiense]|uniref:Uncharacterized protein n=1 Tax=Streptosporangium amethystogenes subsp. fukuiense TaxID=698418 RepID=A0ABW2T4S2_9ACTN
MRIQILPLPSVVVGEVVEEPFALVIDRAEDDIPKELLGEFARQCGAKTFVIVPQTVEIVDRYAESAKDAADMAVESLRTLTEGWPRLDPS